MSFGKAPLHADLTTKVVDVLAETLQRIQRVLQPSAMPGREHYLFSLRHVIVAIQSLRLVDGQTRNHANFLAPFLKHELERIIHDQLVREIDQYWFKDTLNEIFRNVILLFLTHSSSSSSPILDISMGEEGRRTTFVFHLSLGRKKLRTSIEFSDDQRDQSKDKDKDEDRVNSPLFSLNSDSNSTGGISQSTTQVHRSSGDALSRRIRSSYFLSGRVRK